MFVPSLTFIPIFFYNKYVRNLCLKGKVRGAKQVIPSIHKAAAQYKWFNYFTPWGYIQLEIKNMDSSGFFTVLERNEWSRCQFLFFTPKLCAQTTDSQDTLDLHYRLGTALNPQHRVQFMVGIMLSTVSNDPGRICWDWKEKHGVKIWLLQDRVCLQALTIHSALILLVTKWEKRYSLPF